MANSEASDEVWEVVGKRPWMVNLSSFSSDFLMPFRPQASLVSLWPTAPPPTEGQHCWQKTLAPKAAYFAPIENPLHSGG
jgi:hypothetical protein